MTKKKQTNESEIQPPLLSISVKQDHIDTAVPKNSGHCMIADAVKDGFFAKHKRMPKNVQVDLQTIRLTDEGKRYIYLTPPMAQTALLNFDHGIKPKPLNFRMNRNSVQVIPVIKTRGDKKARSEQKKTRNARLKAKVRTGNITEAIKVGGKAPPVGVLSGNRRNFGLRRAGLVEEAPTV